MAAAVEIVYKPPLTEWRKFFSGTVITQALREELNYTGRLARTQLRRKLSQQTLIPYGEVSKAVNMRPAYGSNLSVDLVVRDKVPTLGRFMTSFRLPPKRQRLSRLFIKGQTAGYIGARIGTMRIRVWSGSQMFPVHSPNPFVLPGTRLIVVRTGKGHRAKLRALSGPNLAGGKGDTGEIQRGQTKQFVNIELPVEFSSRVMARMERIMASRP